MNLWENTKTKKTPALLSVLLLDWLDFKISITELFLPFFGDSSIISLAFYLPFCYILWTRFHIFRRQINTRETVFYLFQLFSSGRKLTLLWGTGRLQKYSIASLPWWSEMQLVQIKQINSVLCTHMQSSALSTTQAAPSRELFYTYSYFQKGDEAPKRLGGMKQSCMVARTYSPWTRGAWLMQQVHL